MRTISFHSSAFEEFNDWASSNPKIYKRIVTIIKDVSRTPFTGIGKPEALKNQLKGYWSRRIDNEHRLVYEVRENEIIIVSCKSHYYL